MSLKKRPAIFILRVINDHSSLVVILIDVINSFDINEKKNKEKKSFEAFTPNISHISTPESSVFQASKPHFKRSRIRISHIHKHINMRNNQFVYNRYSKVYIVINNTKAMIKYLKKAYFIDFTVNNVVAKKIKEKTIIDTIIFRDVEINIKTEEKRKKELMSHNLDKIILKYLFLR